MRGWIASLLGGNAGRSFGYPSRIVNEPIRDISSAATESLELIVMNAGTGGERLAARDELLTLLGMLIRPISDLLEDDSSGTAIRHVRARFRADYKNLMQSVSVVCRPNPQLSYDEELIAVKRKAWQFDALMTALLDGRPREALLEEFHEIAAGTANLIRDIPADDLSSILPAASPFNAYQTLRALCGSAQERLELFDPYADGHTIVRYLSEAAPSVAVRLVTSSKAIGAKSAVHDSHLRSVADLFGQERGNLFSLLVNQDLHDRHLRVDDAIYHLGGSVKDAGRRSPYTITQVNDSPTTSVALDQILAEAESAPRAPGP